MDCNHAWSSINVKHRHRWSQNHLFFKKLLSLILDFLTGWYDGLRLVLHCTSTGTLDQKNQRSACRTIVPSRWTNQMISKWLFVWGMLIVPGTSVRRTCEERLMYQTMFKPHLKMFVWSKDVHCTGPSIRVLLADKPEKSLCCTRPFAKKHAIFSGIGDCWHEKARTEKPE